MSLAGNVDSLATRVATEFNTIRNEIMGLGIDHRRINILREQVARSYDLPPAYNIPTISVVADASISTFISSGALVAPLRVGGSGTAPDTVNETHWKYHGLTNAMMQAQSSNPTQMISTSLKPGGTSQSAWWPFFIEFDTNSDKFAMWERFTVSNQSMPDIVVDGKRVFGLPTARTNSGTFSWTCITFPDARPRRIGWWTPGSNQGFGGIYFPTGHTAIRPKQPSVRKIAIIGDSFVNGSGSYSTGASLYDTFAWRVADNLGADEIILGGIGGTGWSQESSGGADVLTNHFGGGRLDTVLTMNPDVIIFVGSVNDSNNSDTEIQDGVELALGKCTAVPEVYVIGAVTKGNDAMNTSVKTATLAAGYQFFDLANTIYGTGKVGTVTGDGNADYYLMSDGIHPSYAGQQFLVTKIVQAILAGKVMS